MTGHARLETELILACASPPAIDGRRERVRALLSQDLDWDYVLALADAHAVTPLLYWELKATDPKIIPTALAERFQQNTYNSLRLTADLFRLIELFESEHIHVLPFKGPTLAVAAYENLALRDFADLDLLVPEHDALRARDILLRNGYTADLLFSKRREKAYLRVYDEFLLRGPGGGQPIVELHWAVTPRHFSVPLNIMPFWGRAEPICLAGRQISTLCADDLLLVLCLHGAKHCWSHLSMIADLGWLAMTRNVGWNNVMERARLLGSLRMVLLGAELASRLLNFPLPPAVARSIAADQDASVLAAQVAAGLFHSRDTGATILSAGSFHMKAREYWQDRIRYFVRLATTATIEDWEAVDLPLRLDFMYPMLRCLRLVKKYWMRIP